MIVLVFSHMSSWHEFQVYRDGLFVCEVHILFYWLGDFVRCFGVDAVYAQSVEDVKLLNSSQSSVTVVLSPLLEVD